MIEKDVANEKGNRKTFLSIAPPTIMNESKSYIDRQPAIMQAGIFIFLLIACSYIMVNLAYVLVGPLFGISGADLLLNNLNEHPESFSGKMNEINAIKFIQLFYTLGIFFLPAIIFGLTKKPGQDFLKLKNKTTVWMVLLAMAIIFLSAPAVNVIYNLNKMLNPQWLGSIGKIFIESEKTNDVLTDLFLKMPHFSDFAFNILMVALIPAIAEELFFRGIIQQGLKSLFKNVHAAVWLTATVFSLFHGDLFGFLPRILLGALLGYLFLWSNSMLVNISAHFINNAAQVVMVYLFQSGASGYDAQHDESVPVLLTIIFTLVMIGLLIIFYRKRVIEIIPEPDHTFNSFTPTDSNG